MQHCDFYLNDVQGGYPVDNECTDNDDYFDTPYSSALVQVGGGSELLLIFSTVVSDTATIVSFELLHYG